MGRAHNALRLEARRFGYLVVLRRGGTIEYGAGRQGSGWVCQCDCGREVLAIGWRLTQGKRRSCGQCDFRWENSGGLGGSHPLDARFLCFSDHPEYGIWQGMWERCSNPNHKHYAGYGGRGITVCERWKDFDQFLSDMRPRPTPQHTIDRKENDGPYAPENCRWATRSEQSRNTRRAVYVEFDGRRVLLVELAAEMGLTYAAIYGRLRNGWALDEALTTPVRAHKREVPLTLPPSD